MNTLPTSIESHFKEAGFSATEILIIKKLVEGDAVTLRELAFKTGKSTGVLDQAMKKLLKKKIVLREMINGTPKYVLHSLGSVMKWLEGDMQNKKRTLEMRHQNFEAFISSISAGKKRPEMQFFEGLEGMKKAYMLLLEKGNDFVQYGPTLFTEMEDPLREFRVQYFRERMKRNIYLRVITHNTPLGRRAISRDPFEYRKTILVDENSYPFSFEKIIVGNTVACFHFETQEACFIEYKELAERERQFFDRLWNLKLEHPDEGVEVSQGIVPVPTPAPAVPLKTRIFSEVREFFLSRKSIVAFGVCGLLAGCITFFLYQNNVSIYTNLIQSKARSIASTGAFYFDVTDLNQLRSMDDIKKPEYSKVIHLLNEIRIKNNDIVYAYIVRPTKNTKEFMYIADADGLDLDIKKDYNFDGKINEEDVATLPGDIYRDQGSVPPIENALIDATAFEPYSDNQWGNILSGWAPIKDKANNTVAILGVDIFSDNINKLANKTFSFTICFIGFFILFMLLRLAAFNRSFLSEVFKH